MEKAISIQALQRLPMYLTFLRTLEERGGRTVSAKQVAEALGLGEIQVRKDLASVSGGGRPKIGYVTRDLITDIEAYLGYHEVNDVIIIGAGKLGQALLSYTGFRDYGLNIVAAFDKSPESKDPDESGKRIYPVEELAPFCKKYQIRIGIITVPVNFAQEVCDHMVKSGILAIWNFAPIILKAPAHILVKNENMATSLAVLSKHLSANLQK